VQNKNFKGASDGYEAFEDWKTGNQLSLAFRNSFPEYNQDDAIMMNNADKYSTLDSDGNRMPDDYEGESKASESEGDEFKCYLCGFKTSDDDKMQYHMEDHDEGSALTKDFLKYEMESKASEYHQPVLIKGKPSKDKLRDEFAPYVYFEDEGENTWVIFDELYNINGKQELESLGYNVIGESKSNEATLVYTKGKGELTSTVKDADSDVLRQWMKDQEDNPEQADNYKAVKKLLKDRGESNEAGSEDHGCADCGFTTSDNSEYIDHLNSHEE